MTKPPKAIEEDLRRDHGRYQRIALALTAFAVLLSIGIGVVELVSLSILRAESGDTARARETAALEGLVVRIDCTQRNTLQQVIDGLVEEGLLDGDAVRVLLDECQTVLAPRTTTTTEEPNR